MAINNPTFPLGASLVSLRLVLQLRSNKHVAYLNAISRDSVITLQRLEALFQSASVGAIDSNVDINTNGGYASGTVTLASHVNADTVTINGTVLTASTTLQDTTHYKVGATDIATATNLATCINANTNLNSTVFAQQAATPTAVVTVTCRVPGRIGILCTLAISAHGSVSAANMTGGTDGTNSVNSHGL